MKTAKDNIVKNTFAPTSAKLFLIGLIALGWGLMIFYPVHTATHHDHASLLRRPVFFQALSMWLIMVLAMMVPTLSPVFGLRDSQALKLSTIAKFVSGYLVAWTGFCVAATFLQSGLRSRALLDTQMSSTAVWLSALLLIGAGLYQFTDRKKYYLKSCHLSLKRLKSDKGQSDAVISEGLGYGIGCIKCCWPMMLTMFVFGLMNIYAMAALTGLMMAEKIPGITGPYLKLTGIAFIVSGLFVLIG